VCGPVDHVAWIARSDAARREAEQRRRDEERFASVGGDALRLVTLNRESANWIADQAPSVQRLLAGVAAEQACRHARLSADWVTPALAPLRRGLALPKGRAILDPGTVGVEDTVLPGHRP